MEIKPEEIMEVAKEVYSDENDQLLTFWNSILEEHKDLNKVKEHSNSLTVFILILKSVETLNQNTKAKRLNENIGKIKKFLQPYIDNDLMNNLDNNEIINDLIKEDFQEVGSSLVYHRIREAIGMNLFEIEDDIPTVKIKDVNSSHVAKILPNADEDMVLNNGEIGQWEVLMTQAITSMDDYTADTFDIISIMWMNKAKSRHDMITFSHEDVLKLRQLEKLKGGKGSSTYSKVQRIEVMKRLAAIASIWISVNEDEDISIVENLEKNKDFRISKFRRLFQVDNVTFAHDRKTNEAIGIYECDIRPTDLLAKYLYGNKKTTSFLSLKALQYNPVKHKFHKRLTRYFSWQWKIRSGKNEFEKPFNIGGDKGLLSVIGFEHDEKKPYRTRETLENILDKLTEDEVIGGWSYLEIDEEKMKGKGRYENYWFKLKIIIHLPKELKNEFKRKKVLNSPSQVIDYNQIAEFGKILHPENKLNNSSDNEQLFFPLEIKRLELTPQNLEKTRKLRGLTITKAASEIGIAHTTLSRYEKGLIKRPNETNDAKIKQWMMNG